MSQHYLEQLCPVSAAIRMLPTCTVYCSSHEHSGFSPTGGMLDSLSCAATFPLSSHVQEK